MKTDQGLVFILVVLLCKLNTWQVSAASGKIVDFGSKLPEYIDQYPDKSWLIKFYAPWCYHCQQLEPIFVNVAEYIYHNHDNMIVGRVDCTKYNHICDNYNVRSYPKIAYLNKNLHVTYNGDRSTKSIVEFAERLNGPDVLQVNSCHELQSLVDKLGLIVLFINSINGENSMTPTSTSSELYIKFTSFALSHKSRYWFYQTTTTSMEGCKYFLDDSKSHQPNDYGLFIVKKNYPRAIKFKVESEIEDMEQSLENWLENKTLPAFGQVHSGNIDRVLNLSQQLVIAILDEYKPAKKLSKTSSEFKRLFEQQVARYIGQEYYDSDKEIYRFAWTTDLNLIKTILIGHVPTPNVIILQPNYTYHLVFDKLSIEQDAKSSTGRDESKLPAKLIDFELKNLLDSNDSNHLKFHGGNTFFHSVMRQLYGQYSVFADMYSANPLLASIVIGLPSIIILFVVYTTCFYDSNNDNYNSFDMDNRAALFESDEYDSERDDQEEENNEDLEKRELLKDHLKTD